MDETRCIRDLEAVVGVSVGFSILERLARRSWDGSEVSEIICAGNEPLFHRMHTYLGLNLEPMGGDLNFPLFLVRVTENLWMQVQQGFSRHHTPLFFFSS